jgi:hypothetical protein
MVGYVFVKLQQEHTGHTGIFAHEVYAGATRTVLMMVAPFAPAVTNIRHNDLSTTASVMFISFGLPANKFKPFNNIVGQLINV